MEKSCPYPPGSTIGLVVSACSRDPVVSVFISGPRDKAFMWRKLVPGPRVTPFCKDSNPTSRVILPAEVHENVSCKYSTLIYRKIRETLAHTGWPWEEGNPGMRDNSSPCKCYCKLVATWTVPHGNVYTINCFSSVFRDNCHSLLLNNSIKFDR